MGRGSLVSLCPDLSPDYLSVFWTGRERERSGRRVQHPAFLFPLCYEPDGTRQREISDLLSMKELGISLVLHFIFQKFLIPMDNHFIARDARDGFNERKAQYLSVPEGRGLSFQNPCRLLSRVCFPANLDPKNYLIKEKTLSRFAGKQISSEARPRADAIVPAGTFSGLTDVPTLKRESFLFFSIWDSRFKVGRAFKGESRSDCDFSFHFHVRIGS